MSSGDPTGSPGGERECEQRAQAAAYVLRALEREEAERYREHLDRCGVCSAEVSSLQQIVDSLPASTPRLFAPRVLRERVMATVRSEAELLRAAGAEADRPQPARPGRRLRRPQLILTAAAMGVGLLVGALVINTGSQSPATQGTSAQLASAPPGAQAVLRRVDGHAELVVGGVSQPPRGKIYEIWLAREGGAPLATDALFGVNHSGSASVNVPGNLVGVQKVMVTAEPLGGSTHPTSPPIIIATLHSS
jgi:anti-sigma-K factor RskA